MSSAAVTEVRSAMQRWPPQWNDDYERLTALS
jgi:hypothetical protein